MKTPWNDKFKKYLIKFKVFEDGKYYILENSELKNIKLKIDSKNRSINVFLKMSKFVQKNMALKKWTILFVFAHWQ